MKSYLNTPVLTGVCFLLLLAQACKDSDKQTAATSENNIDAARNFIRAALDGKFSQARGYLLPDSVNVNYMDVAERSYERADRATKEGYRSSSINIIKLSEPIRDSVTVVIYSNSFKKDPDTLKLLKVNGQWLVDLKYLYLHDADSIPTKSINDIK